MVHVTHSIIVQLSTITYLVCMMSPMVKVYSI